MKLFKSSVPYLEPEAFDSTDGKPPTAHHGEIDGKFYLSIDDAAVAQYKTAQPSGGGLSVVNGAAEIAKVKAASTFINDENSRLINAIKNIASPEKLALAQLLDDTQYDAAISAAKAENAARVAEVFPASE